MILHVLDALAAAPEISQIIVSLNEPGLLDDYAEVRRLKLLVTAAARPNLVDRVLAAIEGARYPILITTADNVPLTPASVAALCTGAAADGKRVVHGKRGSVSV